MIALTTDQTACEAIARADRHRPTAGRSAELRCGVCLRLGARRGDRERAPVVAVAHLLVSRDQVRGETYSGLCVHERTKSGRRRRIRDHDGEHGYHEDHFGLTADRDQDRMFICTWKCRRGHRLRKTAGAILDEIEHGATVVFIEAA